jgi:toxin ParE1/3/4
MAYRLIWSPTARLDLNDLLAYIATDDLRAARQFARGVFKAIERLQQFPESGRVVPEFSDTAIREVIRKPCRIVYRVKPQERVIEIARIWHAARGIPEL